MSGKRIGLFIIPRDVHVEFTNQININNGRVNGETKPTPTPKDEADERKLIINEINKGDRKLNNYLMVAKLVKK